MLYRRRAFPYYKHHGNINATYNEIKLSFKLITYKCVLYNMYRKHGQLYVHILYYTYYLLVLLYLIISYMHILYLYFRVKLNAADTIPTSYII